MANVGLTTNAAAACLATDLWPDVEPVDPKLADMDVEARKDGSLLGRRRELRQADKVDPLGRQAVDVELVVEPGAGGPVDLDVRRCQEHAAAVGDGDVPQL